jgi:hypothetical protein
MQVDNGQTSREAQSRALLIISDGGDNSRISNGWFEKQIRSSILSAFSIHLSTAAERLLAGRGSGYGWNTIKEQSAGFAANLRGRTRGLLVPRDRCLDA